MNKQVLVIEDDEQIVELLKIHLNDLHCEVNYKLDGLEGFQEGLKQNYDLIILDIMLPSLDGLEVCRKLRAEKITTPILMLTAKAEEIDKVLGLETGADDYLTKPFSIREFIARVKAIFRRAEIHKSASENPENEKVLEYENLSIDVSKRKIMIDSKRVDLTPKEFDLLALMAKTPGKSYSRERLLSIVWGYEFEGYEHTVNSHINRLRSKIEKDLSNPKFILTTWGVGYRFMN